MIVNPFPSRSFTASLQWLRSPLTIALSVGLAMYIGTQQPEIAQFIAPLGEVYIGLLKMCVLPILLSATTGSIGRLIGSPDAKKYIFRIGFFFPLSLLLTSAIATLIALFLGPGKNLTEDTLSNLGVLVHTSGIDLEMSLTSPGRVQAQESAFSSFLSSIIPDNIFSALSEGNTLKVLCFSIIFGISLGFLKKSVTESIFGLMDSTFDTFNQLMNWLTLLLPFGLLSLLSYQLSQQGLEVVASMMNFILTALFCSATIYAACTVVLWRRARQPFLKTLSILREPTVLSLATSSSFACLPSAITALEKGLGFRQETVNLIMPLSLTLCRFGSVVYFALSATFVAQLYGKPLGPSELLIVVFCSVLAGMATSGVTGILTLTMLGIVLEPLQLPLEAVLVLFIAIDPLMDPIRTLGIVHTAMAVTSAIAKPESKPNLAVF